MRVFDDFYKSFVKTLIIFFPTKIIFCYDLDSRNKCINILFKIPILPIVIFVKLSFYLCLFVILLTVFILKLLGNSKKKILF